MKVSVKKVLFVIVCAELMIWYWSQWDVHDHNKQVVYHQNNHEKQAPQKPEDNETVLQKAS
ncbi:MULTISPECIES: hypothetical protein [unclassified Paenibacillus]|uniref:hypothetical protein n=1 Tax=unclassified Paenibacillus TaxID=185978 RepID=UPI0009AE7C88|nr:MULTISPECIES: hypothetical protein [unclassified Paenibacillus]MBE1441116.1 hypothetical protein [Paenibacillus sp. OAS669]